MRKDKTVLIDLGAASGLQRGMDFIVFKEGELIKHPKTGEVLEVEQILTGKIKITNIRANIANAEIIKEENDQEILYGQLVQSVLKPDINATQRDSTTYETGTGKSEVKQNSAGYVRAEFPSGVRDNLASGGQGPSTLQLSTGFYMMGGRRFMQKPKHYVKIDRPVFLMTTEVTFKDYSEFCKETGHSTPDDFSWGDSQRPVMNVTWHGAQAYAEWLTEQTGILYRLPFETEWEWAAKSGLDIQYPWGNSFKKALANCKKCGSDWDNRQTAPVRSFPANAFGFHDMVGNVWEWVEDCWVENYINAPPDQSERKYTGKCGNYTIRGGAWNSPIRQTSTTSRLGVWANTKSNYIGFRLVRDPDAVVSSKSNYSGSRGKYSAPTIKEEGDDWDETPQSNSQNSGWDWPDNGN